MKFAFIECRVILTYTILIFNKSCFVFNSLLYFWFIN